MQRARIADSIRKLIIYTEIDYLHGNERLNHRFLKITLRVQLEFKDTYLENGSGYGNEITATGCL